jgi:hypothetical protein
MNTYTMHVPAGARPGSPDGLDEAELVKDGFVWGAFIFTFLWFFVHRLWLAGLAVLVVVMAFDFALVALDVQPVAALLAQLLLSILIGLEASSLQRWTYARRGRPVADVVTAKDREEAETKAFARWLGHAAPRPAAPPPPVPGAPFRASEPVIGLFPDPERSR